MYPNQKISAINDKDINIVIDTFLGSSINQEKIKQTRKSGFSTINGWREIGAIGKITNKMPKIKMIDFLYLIISIEKYLNDLSWHISWIVYLLWSCIVY